MKRYVRPIIFIENFLTNESIAAGTCTRDPLPTDQYKPVHISCFSGKTDTNVFYNQQIGCQMLVTEGNYGNPPSDMTFTSWETAKKEMYEYIISGDTQFDNIYTGSGGNGNKTFSVDDGTTYYAWKTGNTQHVGPISITSLFTNSY